MAIALNKSEDTIPSIPNQQYKGIDMQITKIEP